LQEAANQVRELASPLCKIVQLRIFKRF